MFDRRILFNVAAIVLATALGGLPALAANGNGPDGNGPPGQLKKIHAAPAPLAGIGLPVLAVAGGYLLIRRKRRQGATV